MEAGLVVAEAPTFWPTAEDWEDPLRYICFVRRQAEVIGAAKIVPPAGWDAPLAIDKKLFMLGTRLQSVHQLQSRDTSAAMKQFWDSFEAFQDASGSRVKKTPTIGGHEIDLYRLYRLVHKRGGFETVTEEKGWREILSALQVPDKTTNAAYQIKTHYVKYLQPYEDHCRAKTQEGAGILAAALKAEMSHSKVEPMQGDDDLINEDEAAEILEAMLGLAPAAEAEIAPKKRRRTSQKDSGQPNIKVPENIFTMVCEKCKGGHYEDKIILCDRCDKGWHMFCLSPPMENVPDGDWVCPSCIARDYETGASRRSNTYSLDDFERIAATFERQWYGSDERAATTDPARREADFWRIVNEGEDVAEVLIATDVDPASPGLQRWNAGHPKESAELETNAPPGSNGIEQASSWDLTKINDAAGDHGSLLRSLNTETPGLTCPALTVGMLFSSFGWQLERHLLYRLEYLHWGASRRVYVVPAHAAALFEREYRDTLPPSVAVQPELLYSINSLMCPQTLAKAGVPVASVMLEPGTLLLTFPNAYHTAVSLGVNCSEVVSIAPGDWLRYGAMSVSRYRHFRKPSSFSHDRLVVMAARCCLEPVTAATNGHISKPPFGPRMCYWVSQELGRIVEEERVMRAKLWSEGLVRSCRMEDSAHSDAADPQCAVCHISLYLSAVECDCSSLRSTCLHHASALCECVMRRRRLVWRHTLHELDNLVTCVAARIPDDVVSAIDTSEAEIAKIVLDAAAGCIASAQAAMDARLKGTLAEVVGKKDEVEDLAELAGFMSELGGADGGDAAAAVAAARQQERIGGAGQLTLVTGNGFVQGPIHPFQTLDVYPEDRDAATDWLRDIARSWVTWHDRAVAALEQGGAASADLSDLVEEAEQFLWGSVGVQEEARVLELRPRLANAEDYMAAVNAAVRGKPSLETVEALVAQEPKPLANPPGLDALREAAVAAREWLTKNAALFAPDAPPVDFKTLEGAVAESNRLPVALAEAKALRDRLTTARKVGEAIRGALPTAREVWRRKKDEEALTAETLHSLAAQATQARVDMPEVANLMAAIEKMGAWQARVAEVASGVDTPLDLLRTLLEEADALPAVLPEVEHLKSMVDRSEAWVRQASALMRNRAPLTKLRNLVHAGSRLPAMVPEVEMLKAEIKRREWEDIARKASSTKGTLHALIEVLSMAAGMGAEESPLAITLQGKVDAAAGWEKRAGAFVGRLLLSNNNAQKANPGENNNISKSCGCSESERATLEEVAELTAEGTATGVKMERLNFLTQQLHAANKWVAQARECLPEPDPVEEPLVPESPGEIPEKMKGPTDMEIVKTEDQSTAVELRGIDDLPADEITGPGEELKTNLEPKLEPKLAPTTLAAPRPKYDVLESLLKDYEERLIVKFGEAEGLRALKAGADAWLEEARPVLELEFVVDEQLPLLEKLIRGGRATGVAMEQVDILEANVEALQWGQVVRGLMERLPEIPATWELIDLTPRPEDTLTIADMVASGSAGGIPPPDHEDAEAPAGEPVRYEERPPLARMIQLLEEGSILPCDESLFQRFKRHVEAGRLWERSARSVLTASTKDGGPVNIVGVRQLRKFVAQGERLGVALPALPRLLEVLRTHEKWEVRVRDLMASAGTRPAFAELQVFQQTARMSPVTSNLRRHIDTAVEAVEEWMERCRRTISKRNTGTRLDRCFEILGQSIDSAVEQFERRLEVEKRLVAAGPRCGGPGPNGEEDEGELYCLCQQPYSVDTTMISCDICGEWYHMRCIGMTQAQARSLRKYTCPVCAAVRNSFDALEYALGRLRRTLRPTRDQLGELLTEIKALPTFVEDEAALERLLVKFDRWATATHRAVEVHEASRKKDSVGAMLPLSDGMLHQLCKSALAMEIDGSSHADRILHLLRCNRWRARVDAVLGAGAANAQQNALQNAQQSGPGKANAEAVAKLLLEADRLGVDAAADVAGARLLDAAEATRAWKEAVNACIVDLKAAGDADNPAFAGAADRAKQLISAAEALPIRVDRELEKLEEYSKPYCLCRKAYDEQMPMLECDQCGEWYHFGCVGLGAPGGSEDNAGEADVVPDSFSCPICCLRSGTKYAFYHRLPRTSIGALEQAAAAMPPSSGAAQQMSQPQLQAAAAQMAQMATMFSPQWQQYALAAAQRGGMMSPQAMQSMMEASAQAQAQAHMMMQQGAMGYNPFMFAGHMHPALAQAYQAQVAAVAAAAAQQQQQQALQQPKEMQKGEDEENRPTKKQRNDEDLEEGGHDIPIETELPPLDATDLQDLGTSSSDVCGK